MPSPRSQRHGPRWWIPVLISSVAAAVGSFLWQLNETNHQERNIQTAIVVLVTGLLLFVWLIFSTPPKTRRRIAGTTLLMLGFFLGCFRPVGVTGDLVPIFEWRWRRTGPVQVGNTPNLPETNQSQTSPATGFGPAYPQFLGPSRNAVLPPLSLDRNWTRNPPQQIWRRPLGAAWSGFAIDGGLAITQEQLDDREFVSAYDLRSGVLVWQHSDDARYATAIAGEGPRATPAVENSRVYTLGGTGILNCLDLRTGRGFWTRNLSDDASSGVPEWGFASSPLLTANHVVVSPPSAGPVCLLAYDKSTGAPVWKAEADSANYSSPVLLELAGHPQILSFNSRSVSAHDPLTGMLLWKENWPSGHPHVAVPVAISSDSIAVSSGYGTGAARFQIGHDLRSGWNVRTLWRNRNLKAKFNNFVHRAGFIYGLDDGILVCLDAATGQRRWKDGRYGHGQFILSEDILLITCESGEIVLVETNPEEHREVARMQVFRDKTWNPPALIGNVLLLRNHLEAACLRLSTISH